MVEICVGCLVGLVCVILICCLVRASKRQPLVPAGNALDLILSDDSGTHVATADTRDAARLRALRQNLRVKFLHDESKVERALVFERNRMPNAPEVQLLESAIYRWERDNR